MQKGALQVILAVAATIALSIAAPLQAQIPPDVSIDPVPGLPSFSGALGLKHAGDGSGRLFVIQQDGVIRVIDGSGTALATPFVDVSSRITTGSERGLLDLAFHPEYSTVGAPGEGKFYLHYSAGSPLPPGTSTGDTVVAEFSVTGNPNVGSSVPDRIVLTVAQDFSNHNGGQMRFGPDGYLYLGLGDGGSGNDPCDRAQTLDPADIQTGNGCRGEESVALLGKMLRIDVDNTTPAGTNNLCGAAGNGSAEYAVPPENPFFGQADRCGEVLLYGLRNPWRWSFDRQTQDIWIGDVGQNTTEEIDLLEWPVAGGDNLGWRVCEGTTVTGASTAPCPIAGSVLPVIEYARSGGNCSVTGGYRYRGPVVSLRGRYIFSDFCSGTIWFGRDDGGSWVVDTFGPVFSNVRSFGEDEAGNVYVFAGSTLNRFNGDIELLFADGFES